jgi:hypothetical protein
MTTPEDPGEGAVGVRLRDAFAGYTLEVSTLAVAQRAHRRRRTRIAVRMSGAAAIVVLALIVPLVLSSQSPAYGWTASPSPVDSTLARRIQTACRPNLPGQITGDEQSALTIDRRGRAAVSLFERGHRVTVCMVIGRSDFAKVDAVIVSQSGQSLDGRNRRFTLTAVGTRDGRFSVVFGDAESSLSRIELVRKDGVVVEPTVKNGHYLVWWPRIVGVRDVRATDSSGNRIVLFRNGNLVR